MIRVILETKESYIASDIDDLLRKLAKEEFSGANTSEEYMERVRKRCATYGTPIFFSNRESFLKELLRVGVIIEITEFAV